MNIHFLKRGVAGIEYSLFEKMCCQPRPFHVLRNLTNKIDHNSLNFQAKRPKFCMQVDLDFLQSFWTKVEDSLTLSEAQKLWIFVTKNDLTKEINSETRCPKLNKFALFEKNIMFLMKKSNIT